jgi:hypothetical protein
VFLDKERTYYSRGELMELETTVSGFGDPLLFLGLLGVGIVVMIVFLWWFTGGTVPTDTEGEKKE